MLKLTRFEIKDYCKLDKYEIQEIREGIEYCVNVINEALKDGRDYYLDGFINSYERQLSGMMNVCSLIGISVKTTYIEPSNSSENEN